MTSEQPSLFDQLTPSDALRTTSTGSTRFRRRNRPHRRASRRTAVPTGSMISNRSSMTTSMKRRPLPNRDDSPATVQDTFALPPVSEGATDTTPVPQSTGVENDQTAEHQEPSMPSSDTRPMPAFPLPPRPAMEDANVPDEAENTRLHGSGRR